MLETERLLLRPFLDADREAFARINADPRVACWFGGPVDRAASDAVVGSVPQGIHLRDGLGMTLPDGGDAASPRR